METRANYLLVGSFVILIASAAVVFVLWLANFQFTEQFTRYDIKFDGSVSGMKVGSTVEINGIPVGEVIDIQIDPDNVETVIVTIEVPSDTPVKDNTVARMQLKGITGGITVQLAGGTQDSPPLSPEPGQERAVIASAPSALAEILEGAPELMESVQSLVARAAVLLGPENQAAFADTLANFSALSGALAARSDDIQLLITDASQTMTNLRTASAAMTELAANAQTTIASIGETADTVSDAVDRTHPEVTRLVGDLRGTARSMSNMAGELQAMVAENRAPLRDFTGEGLYELTNFMVEARALIDSLERVTTQVERDPARFLFGNQQQGYETPNQ